MKLLPRRSRSIKRKEVFTGVGLGCGIDLYDANEAKLALPKNDYNDGY
jgi:hypothetical protein